MFFAFGDVLESNKTKIFNIFGKDKLLKKIDSEFYEVDVSAFNQVNDYIEKSLYNYVSEQLKNARVINAYSGQGLLTYLLAKKCKFVYGIEYQESAHAQAEKLKEKIKEYKIENICGKVEENIEKILMRDQIDAIVLDPARNGCEKIGLEEIKMKNINKIIYISCNFATLTRDLSILNEKYNIFNVKIFDMFPCTANMETVVILKRK